ncbi:MAG: hypothetical protein JWO02_2647 [Solirubrobacterales bacterium]|nr:hypothetical protein [Solirubrobacterales bacterium]
MCLPPRAVAADRRRLMAAAGALLCSGLVAVAAGCGTHDSGRAASAGAALPLARQSPYSAKVRRVTPAQYRGPIASYRRHVLLGLTHVQRDVTVLDAAVDTTTAGLPRAIRDPHFTGLHRVELALFGRRCHHPGHHDP